MEAEALAGVRWARRHRQRKRPFCTPAYAGEIERFRPKKFNPELISQVRSSIGKTAKALGVSKNTVWLWSRHIPAFKAKLDEESLRAFLDRTRKRLEELEARTLRTLGNEPELKRAFEKIVQGRKAPRK
jgi:hypothetical protein